MAVHTPRSEAFLLTWKGKTPARGERSPSKTRGKWKRKRGVMGGEDRKGAPESQGGRGGPTSVYPTCPKIWSTKKKSLLHRQGNPWQKRCGTQKRTNNAHSGGGGQRTKMNFFSGPKQLESAKGGGKEGGERREIVQTQFSIRANKER